jgi:hypothetical protein
MKSIFNLLILILLFPFAVLSQGGVELVPFGGYMFGGSVNYYEGKLKIENGGNYGVALLVPVQELVDVEVNYTRMDSRATFSPYSGYPDLSYAETNLATNYFQVGGISKFYTQQTTVTPFGSLSLGATWFDPEDSQYQDVWRFSVTAGLGIKAMFSDRVGIMLRGRLMMPMIFSGGSLYVGTGGSGFSLGSFIAPLQGDFNGGLVIKLGGD